MPTIYFITPALDRVDSWSWFPSMAAHGMFDDTAGANAASIDFTGSVASDPKMLSPESHPEKYSAQLNQVEPVN